jgi:hypothetical protein
MLTMLDTQHGWVGIFAASKAIYYYHYHHDAIILGYLLHIVVTPSTFIGKGIMMPKTSM